MAPQNFSATSPFSPSPLVKNLRHLLLHRLTLNLPPARSSASISLNSSVKDRRFMPSANSAADSASLQMAPQNFSATSPFSPSPLVKNLRHLLLHRLTLNLPPARSSASISL